MWWVTSMPNNSRSLEYQPLDLTGKYLHFPLHFLFPLHVSPTTHGLVKGASPNPVTVLLQQALCWQEGNDQPKWAKQSNFLVEKEAESNHNQPRGLWESQETFAQTCKALCEAVSWERVCATAESGTACPYSHVNECTAVSSQEVKCVSLQEHSLWDPAAKPGISSAETSQQSLTQK